MFIHVCLVFVLCVLNVRQPTNGPRAVKTPP